MSEVKWIKLATDIFDNRKIRQIEKMPDGDAIIVIWLKLLILAGDVNDGGLVYFTKEIPYTEQLLATQFDRPLAVVQFALRTFERFSMIEIVDDLICVSNWEKYQNVESLDRIREQNRLRKQRQREREKLLESHVTVTQSHATDKEEEKDIEEEEEKNKTKRFKAPTVEEVAAYCKERNNAIDAQHFVDYYEARNWMLGKVKMKDWKAAVRTWEKKSSETTSNRKYTTAEEYEKQKKPDVDIDKLKSFLNSM